MKRREIWWAELPPPVGNRPVVILTRDKVFQSIGGIVVALVVRGGVERCRSRRPEATPHGDEPGTWPFIGKVAGHRFPILRLHLLAVAGRFGSGGALEISRWSSRSAAQPPENLPKEYAPWKGAGTVASAQETLGEHLAVMLDSMPRMG